MAEMTRDAIWKALKEYDGYKKPELNDQLYLQCRGFIRISEELSAYVNVRALWLQQNALSKIENLDDLEKLGCLFLHQNCISRIENLGRLTSLHTLNLSQNYITKVEGLAGLTGLETLQLAHNRITRIANLRGVLECPNLSTLDISHNGLEALTEEGEAPEDLIALLQQLPELKCIYLQGNELPNQTRYFRRKVVGGVKTLTYMDERPVFEEERRAVDAWMVGGFEAEQAERDRMRAEKKAVERENLRKYREMQEKARPLKEQREREMLEREEAEKAWRAEMQVVHQREQCGVADEESEGRAAVANEAAQEWCKLTSPANGEREKAAAAQQAREELERVEQEAKEELEKEAEAFQTRRMTFVDAMHTTSLTTEQEHDFLKQEASLAEEVEAAEYERFIKEVEQLTLLSPKKGAAATAPRPRHTDPCKHPQKPRKAGTSSIWETFSAWEARGTRR